MTDLDAPLHHDRPMYHDTRDGTDMRRWLCTEPGCEAVLADDTLARMREMAWPGENGLAAGRDDHRLPAVTRDRPANLVEGSGRAMPGRALDQMTSVRFNPALLEATRLFAARRGGTISDVIRVALTGYLEENSADPPCLGWPEPARGEP